MKQAGKSGGGKNKRQTMIDLSEKLGLLHTFFRRIWFFWLTFHFITLWLNYLQDN